MAVGYWLISQGIEQDMNRRSIAHHLGTTIAMSRESQQTERPWRYATVDNRRRNLRDAIRFKLPIITACPDNQSLREWGASLPPILASW